MNGLIDQIIARSGPLPNAARYRRHLRGLSGPKLLQRLRDLEGSESRGTGGGQWERPAPCRRPALQLEAR